jgi:hypothetical protein
MHTFKTEHNCVEWILKVQGFIHMFPDVKDDYEVNVLPQSQCR